MGCHGACDGCPRKDDGCHQESETAAEDVGFDSFHKSPPFQKVQGNEKRKCLPCIRHSPWVALASLPGCFLSVPFQNLQKFLPVSSDQLFFQGGCLKFHSNVIVIRGYQTIAPLEVCNVHHLRFREMQDLFHPLRLFVFQVQDKFSLAVVYDSLSVLAVIQGKKVV